MNEYGREAIAVNRHPRVWFSRVWSEEGYPSGLRAWTEDQMAIFSDMLGSEPPWKIAAAIGRPLREVLWFEHACVRDGILDEKDDTSPRAAESS